jgi:two-component system, response regulator
MIELKTILIVEDNYQDVELITEALSLNNLVNQLIHVNDGVEAIEYLKSEGAFIGRKPETPSVILLDIKMPRMDGIEFLEIVKNDEKFKTIPIVMLTSSREEPDLLKCYQLGVNAYVVKPVDFKDFLNAVKQIGVFWALLNEQPNLQL